MLTATPRATDAGGGRDAALQSTARQIKISLMVVDDHPAVRWGLVQLLDGQRDFRVAAVCINADGVVARAEAERIDVAVLDYYLGGRNGLWLCRQLKRLPQPPRVIVFSAFANDHLAAVLLLLAALKLLSSDIVQVSPAASLVAVCAVFALGSAASLYLTRRDRS